MSGQRYSEKRHARSKRKGPSVSAFPVRIEHPLDVRMDTVEQLREFLGGVSFGPNLPTLRGGRWRVSGMANAAVESSPGGQVKVVGPRDDVPFMAAGFLVTYSGESVNADDARREFSFEVECWISPGTTRFRVLECLLDRFDVFMRHELREALRFDARKVFDPHEGVS